MDDKQAVKHVRYSARDFQKRNRRFSPLGVGWSPTTLTLILTLTLI